MQRARISVTLLGVLALAACGGGSGGSGGSGGNGGGSQGTLVVSPSTLTFTASDGSFAPLTQDVTATLNTSASGAVYFRIVTDGPAVANVRDIVVTGTNTGRGTVVPAAPGVLGPGNHTSTITVTACTSGPACTSGVIGTPQTIAVNYQVSGVRSSPAVSFTLDMTTAPSDYTMTLPVVAYPSFTATSSANWLTVTPSSGSSTTSSVTLSLVQASVDAFESGEHTATLALHAPTSSPTGFTREVPVTLTVRKPQLDQVAPYVAESNQAGTVTVRGSFFDLLPANSIDLSLTSTGTGIAPTNVEVVSPTELTLTHPALAAGTYLVRMRDAQGALIDRSTGRLVVVDPPNFAAGTLAYADARLPTVQSLVYDAERRMLLMTVFYGGQSLDATELLRWEHTSSGWSLVQTLPIPYLDRIALSADGRDLITSSSPEQNFGYHPVITLRSPTTLAERASAQTGDTHTFFAGLAVLSTNEVMTFGDSRTLSSSGWPAYSYSVKRNAFTRLTVGPELSQALFDEPVFAVSGDGQRVVAGESFGRVYEYDASSSSTNMSRAPLSFRPYRMSLDRTGETLLAGGTSFSLAGTFLSVFDRDWNERGTIPRVDVYDHLVSPDGTRVYTYHASNTVRVYDLTAPTVAGEFPESHVLTLTDEPSDSSSVRMIITPDGRTLFIAGRTQVVIVPVP